VTAAALAAGGALLAVMIAQSWYGAVTLPPAARIPVHWGFGWGNYRSKRTGLIIWPVAGAVVYGLLGGTVVRALPHSHQGRWAPVVLMIVVMGALAAFEAGALAAARRSAGGTAMGPAPQPR
jgi:hypothetical protein